MSNIFGRPYLPKFIVKCSLFAQVDAGALQRGLEQQLPLPSPLALPEPVIKEGGRISKSKEGEVRFTVNSFVLEGVSILPEADIQVVLKPWVGKDIDFEDLQSACDAIQEYYRKKGFTVQAILPPQKIAGGVVKILVTEAAFVVNPEAEGRVHVSDPDRVMPCQSISKDECSKS